VKKLTERQKLILSLVVQEYMETAKPVGSRRIVEQFNLEISSATVRNEMAELAEKGYLRQPHTSAGRIPTEEGYRFFVSQLMQRPSLPANVKHTIEHQFYQAERDIDHWMRLTASVLAQQSRVASLVTAPHAKQAQLKQIQLIATTGRQVLMVLVLVGGKVRQQMLVLKESVAQEQLSAAADRLNTLFSGREVSEIEAAHPDLDALGDDIRLLLLEELNRSESWLAGEVYHDGWSNVLGEPEFANSTAARKALRVIEERPLLEDLLNQTVVNTDVGGVQVLIGGEGNWEELSEFSLVLARYGVPEIATGFLGVLGPVRMAYGNAISTVHFVSGLLSNLVNEVMGSELQDN
jgi:heat-inducible transcriptional repressor